MSYDTKLIVALMSQILADSKTVEEAHRKIELAVNSESMLSIEELRKLTSNNK